MFSMHKSALIFFHFLVWSFEYVEQADVIELHETGKLIQQCYLRVIWKQQVLSVHYYGQNHPLKEEF